MNGNIFTLKGLTSSEEEFDALSVMNWELLADRVEVWQRWPRLVYSWVVQQLKNNVGQNISEVLRVKNADYIFDVAAFQSREDILDMRRDFVDYTFFRKSNIDLRDFIDSLMHAAEIDIKVSEDIQVGSLTFLVGNPFIRQWLLYKLRKHPLLQHFTFEGVNVEGDLKNGAAIMVDWSSLITRNAPQRDASKAVWLATVNDNDIKLWSWLLDDGGVKNTTIYTDFVKKAVLDESVHIQYQDYPILSSTDDTLRDQLTDLYTAAEDALHMKSISKGHIDFNIFHPILSHQNNNVLHFPVNKKNSVIHESNESIWIDTSRSWWQKYISKEKSFVARLGSKVKQYSWRMFDGLSHALSSFFTKFKSKTK